MVSKAIDSALAQTYPNTEVLVVDNASSDNIETLIATYSDKRVKFYKNTHNLGIFGNFNRCIELSHGKYIHILHSDDYIDSRFTETCVEFLERNPSVAMTFTSMVALSGETHESIGVRTHDQVFPAPEGFREILRSRNLINCPSVMVRKEVYVSMGLFSLEYPYSGDLYQWLIIARQFDIAYVSGATLFYRQGAHSVSYEQLFKTPSGYIDPIKIFIRIVNELGDDLKVYSCELNSAYRRHMRDCLFAGIARSDSMSNYSSMIFIGFALSTWSMIRPLSLSDRIKKAGNFFLICSVASAIIIPGGQYLTRKIFRWDTKSY